MGRHRIVGAVSAVLVGSCWPSVAFAAPGPNPVADWATIVQPAIHNASEPRSQASSIVLHTITQLAVYDAVVAINGGYTPFQTAIQAPKDADLSAAVATAAYRTARGRVAPSQFSYLDDQYHAYLAPIPEGAGKQHGVEVGQRAADGILALRAHDGFDNTVTYQCSANPPPLGEFEPEGGCGGPTIDAKLAQVTPFTFSSPSQFRPPPPEDRTSDQWAMDFNEVKDYGRKDSAVRTAEQTDVAYFWSEHAYVFWNRNLLNLATARGLGAADTARFLATVYTATADAAIAGFEAKYFYRSWRPRTAVPRVGDDHNPKTAPDPAWTPLLSVNHPEYPSGHSFIVGALTQAVASFFGTDQVDWTLQASKATIPQLVLTERRHQNLKEIVDEVSDARVWAGLHFRNSMNQGIALGARVEQHVVAHTFAPRPAPPPLSTLPRTGTDRPTRRAAVGLGLVGAGAGLVVVTRRRRPPTKRRLSRPKPPAHSATTEA
jgi:hypothetical protein